MAKKTYQHWDKNDLIKEIEQLRKRKKYGLVWENKPEDVVEQCKTEFPVLEEVKEKEILIDPDKPTNLLIEGDNYHALSVLNYTHKGKIDVIYIDPPYNTGAKDWKYNNDYVDEEDPYRHTKWISLMEHRLKLSKNLLSKEGIICVTIDDYEMPRLWLVMEEIFGEENHLGTIVIRNNPSGRSTEKGVSIAHEYALFFSRATGTKIGRLERTQEQMDRYKERDNQGPFEWVNFRKHGATRKESPKMFYPIFISKNNVRIPEMTWNEKSQEWETTDKPKNDEKVIYPIDDKGFDRRWKWAVERFKREKNEVKVDRDKNGDLAVYIKSRMNEDGMLPLTWWDKKEYSATTHGTNLLKTIFSTLQVFSYPKSLYAVMDCIKVMSDNKDCTVLDFFAGSGTTGHAVLELNKRDGGNRKFILCTNNENKIAEEVCLPRLNSVINGYKYSGTEKTMLYENLLTEKSLINIDSIIDEVDSIKKKNALNYDKTSLKIEDNHVRLYGVKESRGIKEGVGGNLKYFRTSFVSADPTDKSKIALTRKATEMLCIKENTFEKVTSNEQFKVFQNKKKYTGIILDHDAIDDFKKAIAKIDGKFCVYIFSLGDDEFEQEFEDMKQKVKLLPIPEAILRVYRRIFE